MFESVSNPIYGKLRKYLPGTNRYQRRVFDMDQNWNKKQKLKVVYLGGGENKNKKKRNWRLMRRIRVRVILSPVKKLLSKLRDGYINMMLRLAGTSMGSSMNDANVNAFLTKRIPKAREVVVGNKNKITSADLDTKLVLEIYKLLIASRREQELIQDG